MLFLYCCRTYGISVYLGLTKGGDACEKDDVKCRRERWSWEDGTPYDYSVYSEWSDSEGEKNKYNDSQQFKEPESGELCTGMIIGSWYGFQCNETHHCLCKKTLNAQRKKICKFKNMIM